MSILQSIPLGSVAEVIRGVTFSKSDATSAPGDGLAPVLRAGNIQSELLLNEDLVFVSERMISAKQRLRAGDIVMCTSSGSADVVGKTAFLNEDWHGSFGAFCATIRARSSECLPRYLFHYLQTPTFRAWTSNSSGINIKNIRKSELDEVLVPLPALEEQSRIATILDTAHAIRCKRDQALRMGNELLRAAFFELMEEGQLPTASLSEVVAKGTIVTYGIVQAGPEYPGGIPYIRTGDIKDGRIVADGLRRTAPQIAAKFSRSTVRSGDIVMSIRATVGTTAVVPPELDGANLTQGTARIAPGDRVTPEYLLWFLRSDACQHWIEGQVKGATFREITLTRLRELEVPIPPIAAQRAFSKFAQQVETILKKLEQDRTAAKDLFVSLSQRAFRGEL